MNSSELVTIVAEAHDISKAQAQAILDSVLKGCGAGCGANAGDRRKKALGSLTRITRQALHSKSQARFCF